jgi:serine/threonine protein kinase
LSWRDLELLDALGSGHTATVVRARLKRGWHEYGVGSPVAVKLYKPWVLAEPGFIERFFREVEVGRRIIHPNLLRIHGAILNDNGEPALVMELHENATLETELTKRRESQTPYDFPTASRLLRELASALAELHRNGVTHRDVKPANVLLGRDGAVLADFGVIRSAAFPEQTTTGEFLGTIRYAAPEFLFGGEYDDKVDVYSFGCIAYEIYMNRQVFGFEQHWAQLVVTKYPDGKYDLYLDAYALSQLASRIGLRETEFAQCLVKWTLNCERAERLGLAGIAEAIDDSIWESSFDIRDVSFVRAWRHFNDVFGTAVVAAERFYGMDEDERRRLIGILHEHYWTNVAPSVDDDIERRLTALGILRVRDWNLEGSVIGHSVSVAESLREAYALELLDASRVSPA